MKFRKSRQRVSETVRIVAGRFGRVFHISELKAAVWRVLPEAKLFTIYSAVWNLVHKFKLLVSPRNQFYQIKSGSK